MAAKRLILLLWLALAAGCSSNAATSGPDTQRVTIGGRTFTLELALDEQTRFGGLSGRATIPDDGGMLFVFPHPRQLYFVMRDCPNPIDLIFLGPNGRIVSMHAMQPQPGVPESELTLYPSRYVSQFAIELKGGTLAQLGLEPGRRVELPLESLKARAR